MNRRTLLASIAALACVLAPGAALARTAVRLSYGATPQASLCPDSDALRGLVAERLGYDPVRADAEPELRVRIDVADETLRGHVSYYDARGALVGERFLASSQLDCSELSATIALTVSLILEPPRVSPGGAKPAAATAGAATPPIGNDFGGPPEHASHAVGTRLGVETVGAMGTAPAPAVGFSALVGLSYRNWMVDLDGRGDLFAGAHDGGPAGVRSSLLSATLAPCRRVGAFLACPLVTLGSLQTETFDVPHSARRGALVAGVGARLGAEVDLGASFALRGRVDGLASLTQTTLTMGKDQIWAVPPLAIVFGAGLVRRFP